MTNNNSSIRTTLFPLWSVYSLTYSYWLVIVLISCISLEITPKFILTCIMKHGIELVVALVFAHKLQIGAKLQVVLRVFKGTKFKGTNGRQKTYEIFHVYCVFYSGFMCQTTVIFGITKDGSLVLTTLASWNCFTYRNIFQNGANDISECLTCERLFVKKAQNYV